MIQAQRDVTALYSLHNSVLQQDQVLFYASLDLHLLEPLSRLRAWLTINKRLIEYSVRAARTQAKLQTKDIQKYLKKPRCVPPRPPYKTPIPRPKKRSTFPTRMTTHFEVQSSTRTHTPFIRPVSPDSTATPRHPHFQQRYLADFFPDHPS